MECHRKQLDDFFQDDINLMRLRKFAMKMIRTTRGFIDDAYADDLVQETLMSAWKHIDRYEGRAKMTTWMYHIMRNVFLNHLRTQSRIKKLEIEYLKILKANTPENSHEEPVLRLLEEEEVSRGISGAIDHLLPDQKKAYELLTQEKTHEEIAREMGKSENQVRGVLYRARRDIKAALLLGGFVVKNQKGDYRRRAG